VAEDQKGRSARDRRQARPWIHDLFWAPAIGGLLIVAGVAVVYYFQGSCRISNCIDRVPYSNVPFVLIFLASLVEWLEKLWRQRKQRPLTKS
jgi:UDP-N-acetylmuramyl pentapeptide phosphotransferase/UDP-N-acetylglucosamine-1-phosphate transferase